MSRDRRRDSKFRRFVLDYGTRELADYLEIDESAVFHWLGGRTSPDIRNAAAIQNLARGRRVDLSLGDIYELRRAEHSKRGISNSGLRA